MYINFEPTAAIPQGYRFVPIQPTTTAKILRANKKTTLPGLSRSELRKIVIDLIG